MAERPRKAAKGAQLQFVGVKSAADWRTLWQRFLDVAGDFFDSAMSLGVDEAEKILGATISDDTLKRLRDELQARIDANVQFVSDLLRPDVESGLYDSDDPDEQTALDAKLDARLGRYADALYPTAIRGAVVPVAEEGVLMRWILDAGADHCDRCPDLAAGGPYTDDDGSNPLPTYPGDGDTPCFGNCRCSIEFDEESWNRYAAAA